MKNSYFKKIATLLVITIVTTLLPPITKEVYAQETSRKTIEETAQKEEALIVEEIEELREEYSKQFLKSDGTYEAVVYTKPIHYKSGDSWVEIDNTLEEKVDNELKILDEEKIAKDSTPKIESPISEETLKEEIIQGRNSENAIQDESNSNDNNQSEENTSIEDRSANNNSINENKVEENKEKIENSKKIRENEVKNVLTNKNNDFSVNISKFSDSEKLIKITKDDYELSWGIENANPVKYEDIIKDNDSVNREIEEIVSERVSKNSKDKTKEEIEKDKNTIRKNELKKTIENIKTGVNYKNIFKNVDLNYTIDSNIVKENIIINDKVENAEFEFNIHTKNLIAKQNENGIKFYDINNQEEIVFSIEKPYMYDKDGDDSRDIKLEFTETKDGYKLKLIANKEWINSKDRAFPIVIDPIVSTSQVRTDIFDTFVKENDSENKYNNQFLRVGNNYGSVTRSFLKFNIPTFDTANTIIGASMNLLLFKASVSNQINVHNVTSEYATSVSDGYVYGNLLWENQPSYNSRIEDYEIVSGEEQVVSFDITRIVKEWYTTGANNGLMLKSNDESVSDAIFWSSDMHDEYTDARPVIQYAYINNSGLEGYWTYHSQNVGRLGTGYINDYNGNLVFEQPLISDSGNRMPVNISLIYNSKQKNNTDTNGTVLGFGNGWRLNLSQRIVKVISSEKEYYKYIDSDGTEHYFEKNSESGKIKDLSGLDLTMELNYSNGYDNGYLIKDKKDNKYMFTESGYLYKIQDSNNNEMRLQYEGPKLKYIYDGAGRVTTLDLLDNGYLVGITDSSGKKISFGYKGIQLSTIIYPDEKRSTINYDENDRLIEAQNYDGYKIRYEYSPGSDSKVTKAYEVFSDGETGKALIINYGYNTTSFTDLQGRKEVYQFNNWGNTVSIIDANGSGTYYKYGDVNSINKLQSNSKLQNTVTNYLLNHNVEVSNTQWDFGQWGESQGTGEFSTEEKYLGNTSLKVTKSNEGSRSFFNQGVLLEKGKTYTFSAYVKAKDILSTLNKGAGIFVNYQNNDGNYSTVGSSFLSGSTDWKRLYVTFTLPQDAASNLVYFRGGIIEGTGVTYIDSLQVEEGITFNRYNLVENPSFKANGNQPNSIYWEASAYDSSNAITHSTDSTYPTKIDSSKTIYKMGGVSNKNKNVYQVIPVSGKKGDVFVAAGWARGESVPLKTGRYFALDVGIQRVDGSMQWCVIPFNEDTNEWQYVADKVIADSDYTSIKIYGLYYNNSNNVYFDNFQLYKEEFSTSYQYDDKGNVISTQDLEKKNSSFEYNGTNDLIKTVDPKGNNYSYTYDDKHNIQAATTAENVVYSFTYDSYGNPTKATITGGAITTSADAAYTSDGNYIRSITDASGSKVSYRYDDETADNFNNKTISKGNVTSIIDAKNTSTFFNYDDNTNNLIKAHKIVDGNEIANSYTYENDKIKTITHNGFNYIFNYDKAGNNNEVFVGSQKLITNNYNLLTGNLDLSTYGNGHTVAYQYDELNRLIGKKFNGDEANRYTYNYDANGNLALKNDNSNGISTRYFYDLSNKLSQITDSNNNTFKVNYDLNNNISDFEENYNNLNKFKTSYTYDKDNKLKSVVYNNGDLSSTNSETFSLTGNLVGSIGTKPHTSAPIYEKDTDGNIVLASFKRGNNIIVNNSSFESDSANWSLSDWSEKGGSWRIVNDGEFGGKALESYSSNSDSSVTTNAVAYQDIVLPAVLTESKNYTISAYAKRIGEAAPRLSIQCLDSNNNEIEGAYWTYNKNVPENQWTKIYETATIPQNTAKIRVIVRTIVKGSEKVRFDAVQLEESIYSTPYKVTLEDPTPNLYSLGVNKNSGTQGVWMLTKDTNNALMMLGNENANNRSILNLYVDTDNKVKISARNTSDVLSNIAQSNITITPNKWYYTAMTWETNESGVLTATLYVYDKEGNTLDKASGTLENFKDIVGGSTALGSSIPNRYQLNGYLRNFTYSKTKFTDEQITSLYSKGQTTNIKYEYDAIGRLKTKTTDTGSGTYNTSLEYVKGEGEKDTTLVSRYTNGDKTIQYSYDANKNISSIVENEKTTNFTYNDLNELVREDNGVLNKTITYEYDAGGNLLSKKEYEYTTGELAASTKTVNYSYDDSNWKDKLTAYDGKPITYDEIGNPLTYDGYTYSWEGGRRLKSIVGNNNTISYKYNDEGIRTEKTVNDVTTKYVLDGSTVLLETTNDEKIHYTYDSSNDLISMNIISDSNPSINGEYYYIKNAQGDIIGLIDKDGTEVVSYTYDTWGKLVSIEGSLKDTVGVKNPYRYRGYRYDTETGLYYLNSRYYNSDWGRFINLDGIIGTPGELLSANMFAYCRNNPVNLSDFTGYNGGWALPNVFDGFLKVGSFILGAAEAFGVAVVTVGGVALGTIGLLIISKPKELGHGTLTAAEVEANSADSNPNVDDNIEEEILPQQGLVSKIPDAPPVDAGKQGKHVPGHNNYNPRKSAWPKGKTGVRETQEAWLKGEYTKNPKVKTYEKNGVKIKVHINEKGNIHGYPVDKVLR